MSLLHLVCWIVIKIITLVEAAPKLWQILYDPIITDPHSAESSLSDGYLSDDPKISNMRRNSETAEEPVFEGYAFDVNICKEVSGRILCGYNKNTGGIDEGTGIIDLGNGCRIRGDRLECGYDGNNGHLEALRAKEISAKSLSSDAVTTQNIIPAEAIANLPLIRSNPNIKVDTKLSVSITSELLTTAKVDTLTTNTQSKSSDPQSSMQSNTTNTTTVSSDPTITSSVSITPKLTPELNISLNAKVEIPDLELMKSQQSILANTMTVPTILPVTIVSELDMLNKTATATITYHTLTNATSAPNTSSLQLKENIINKSINNEASPAGLESRKSYFEKSEMNVTPSLAAPGKGSSTFKNCETAQRRNLRKNKDEAKIKTMCVEQNDRIVCYDFKSI